eukprot:5360885-Alexandrium_andersonii.AAC.1
MAPPGRGNCLSCLQLFGVGLKFEAMFKTCLERVCRPCFSAVTLSGLPVGGPRCGRAHEQAAGAAGGCGGAAVEEDQGRRGAEEAVGDVGPKGLQLAAAIAEGLGCPSAQRN